MGITVNTSPQQITASVGETKIDVSVGGGVGPTGATGPAGPAGSSYTLPAATASVLGGVKIGSGISIDGSGVISASAGYTLPTATASVLGGVKIGSGISIDGNGVISASSGYTLPTATNSVLGGVKIGSGVTITDGVISVSTNYAAASHTHAPSDITTATTYANFLPEGGSLATAYSGIDSALGDRALTSSLATVATSGAYADLSGLPSIPDADQALKTTDEVRFSGIKIGDNVFRFRPETGPDVLYIEKYNGTAFANWVSFADSGIRFPDGTTQASAFDGAYTSLTSVPSTFAPSAHKTSHATGGSDALSPSDIGAATALHAHSAADVTSGTFDIARIPTGSTSTTVCIGNDARLSDARTPTAHNHAASDINSGVLATARLASSGTASATTFLRGDQTWASAGSTSASDLTSGTLANARMTTRARASMNLYLWSAFR